MATANRSIPHNTDCEGVRVLQVNGATRNLSGANGTPEFWAYPVGSGN